MSTIVKSDLELIMEMDFNIEEPCDLGEHYCDAPAEWKVYLNCGCGFSYNFCDTHRHLLTELFSKEWVTCDSCGGFADSIWKTEPIKS